MAAPAWVAEAKARRTSATNRRGAPEGSPRTMAQMPTPGCGRRTSAPALHRTHTMVRGRGREGGERQHRRWDPRRGKASHHRSLWQLLMSALRRRRQMQRRRLNARRGKEADVGHHSSHTNGRAATKRWVAKVVMHLHKSARGLNPGRWERCRRAQNCGIADGLLADDAKGDVRVRAAVGVGSSRGASPINAAHPDVRLRSPSLSTSRSPLVHHGRRRPLFHLLEQVSGHLLHGHILDVGALHGSPGTEGADGGHLVQKLLKESQPLCQLCQLLSTQTKGPSCTTAGDRGR
mmetsp:Transcript_5267/g.15694  ORF Transcript_5267/g.15694 Transcript_5267/m.15694 type:complete len:291 (+) Transcript_5267:578-1450(+)